MTTVSQKAPLKLFAVQTKWGVPFATAAPFPLKLEAWLRMTRLRYELVIENDPGKGPKQKTPWIVDDDLNPLFRHAASLENLRAYCERMRTRFFPETLAVHPASS